MNELWQLFITFAQIGAVTFGGGYAMLPILTREFVDKRHWVTDSELTDYFAIGQCTPGIIAVNVATFIGNKRKGLAGGIVATLGLVSIPIVIITIIAAFLRNFADYAIIKNAFAGIRVCVCVLIINAILRLWKKSILDGPTLVIFLVVFALSVFSSLSPILLVVAAAAAGILLRQIPGQKGGTKA
ncbi:MAG: chromate transporter [Lachnospiraceae bacterium]|nr:chromate transporter [Lachnospiraceae bacterium]